MKYHNFQRRFKRDGGIQVTKERKLAVKMWQGIRKKIYNNSYISDTELLLYKKNFCARHSLNWINSCWFCQYMPTCELCPLRECRSFSVYKTALKSSEPKKERIRACNTIIAALKGRKVK